MPKGGRTRGDRSTLTTAMTDGGAVDRKGSRFLLATGHGGIRVYPLPDSGEIFIGRSRECQVRLASPSISRRHTRLHIDATCRIADLDSRNGTLFRGERLPPGEERALAEGDSFSVGPYALFLLPAGAAATVSPAGRSQLSIDDPADTIPSPLLLALARAPVSVLIHGETGVGKEVLATTLHRLSGRKGPLVGINCAALSESLLESELFGHERGAFTGAVQTKPGLLQAAAGGTVLLDEVGDLAPTIQAKLLRAIETREILPVGGVRPVPIDVRFIAATHRDLLALTEGGAFRRDLYYRLAGFTLEILPLRERKDRIAALAAQIVAEAAARTRAAPPAITAAASTVFAGHGWPGNVRELRNVVERALLLSAGGDIGPEHLLFDAPPPERPEMPPTGGEDERSRIVSALEACGGNQTRAARMLGMSRTTFVQRLSLHRIVRPRKSR